MHIEQSTGLLSQCDARLRSLWFMSLKIDFKLLMHLLTLLIYSAMYLYHNEHYYHCYYLFSLTYL